MRRRLKKLERTAYHEAGHAVAAYCLKRSFNYVSILGDADSLGKVETRHMRNFDLDGDLSQRTEHLVRREIVLKLAGPLAVELAAGKTGHWDGFLGGAYDIPAAFELAQSVAGSVEESDGFIHWLWEYTRNLLALPFNWAAVEALAATLLRDGRVSYPRARAVIKHALQGSYGEVERVDLTD